MEINKNISIWRGNTAPPTSNHLWQKDGKLYHYDGTSWKENEVDLSTGENDGLMSKEDKHRLDNLVYNGLDSNDTDKALSAKQGKILSNRLEELNLSAYQIRGSVETLDDIPYDDLQSGDVYNIIKPFYIDGKRYPEGTNVVWTGTKLDPLGGVVDFKNYSTTSQVKDMINSSYYRGLSHQVSYKTNTFMNHVATEQTCKCKQLTIESSPDMPIYSITLKIANDQSLLNHSKTYLHIKRGDLGTVSLNGISQMSNLGKYVTWFFDGSMSLMGGNASNLSLHTTNVISEANDNNSVNFIICGQTVRSDDVFIQTPYNRYYTPELAINYVDVSSIYPHMQDIKKHTMSYATSELSDLTTPSHRANIKKIRINQSVMGISLINSVSIMVADDNAYDGQIHLNIYDTNSQQTVVSKNVVNLSNNLGKYVTWYFTPFKLTENVNYEFFADNEQLMRIHVSGNKNEGVVCIDQYSYTKEDFTPALGINIGPIVTDEIYSKVENIQADIQNNKTDIQNNRSEIDAIDSKVINFQYNVDEVRLNLSATNAELDKTKQELSELQAKIQDHEDRIWKLENQWYGIEWDTEVSSPAVTRIGNMDLHRTLPIQSRMRGCLLDDNGKVVEYLNPKDWTGHDLSGARGQVMVEIPSHYRRFETDGTKRRVKMSEYPLPGFNFVKMGYLSANEATIQRSTGKLSSVVNSDPDFRGGNNQAEFDGTYKSVLGKPANYISLKTARDAARKRGQEGDTQWNCYTYDIHVTLTWLYVVEYANRNSQLPFNAELTSEGFHQGGLGSFSIPSADYNSYFKNLPIIPCGCTHHLGNGSGVVNLHLATDDGTYERDILVPRYRGVEVPFGNLFILADGIFGKRADTSSAWTYYATSDPAVFGSDDTTQYRVVGLSPSARYGYIKDIHFGENGDITASQNIGGSSTTFFCDFYENYSNTEFIPVFGGIISLNDYMRNGIFYLGYSYSQTFPSYGQVTRLCFLPAE